MNKLNLKNKTSLPNKLRQICRNCKKVDKYLIECCFYWLDQNSNLQWRNWSSLSNKFKKTSFFKEMSIPLKIEYSKPYFKRNVLCAIQSYAQKKRFFNFFEKFPKYAEKIQFQEFFQQDNSPVHKKFPAWGLLRYWCEHKFKFKIGRLPQQLNSLNLSCVLLMQVGVLHHDCRNMQCESPSVDCYWATSLFQNTAPST